MTLPKPSRFSLRPVVSTSPEPSCTFIIGIVGGIIIVTPTIAQASNTNSAAAHPYLKLPASAPELSTSTVKQNPLPSNTVGQAAHLKLTSSRNEVSPNELIPTRPESSFRSAPEVFAPDAQTNVDGNSFQSINHSSTVELKQILSPAAAATSSQPVNIAATLPEQVERIQTSKQNLSNFEDADLGQLRLQEQDLIPAQTNEAPEPETVRLGTESSNTATPSPLIPSQSNGENGSIISSPQSESGLQKDLNQGVPPQLSTENRDAEISEAATKTAENPELSERGDMDEDLGSFPVRPIPQEDEDFGQLPVRPVPPPPPPPPKWLFGTARIGYFNNSNAFSTTTKQADGLIRTSLTLTALPRLGKRTYFRGSINGSIIRYGTFSQLNYDELRLRAGILQQLSPRMYGELGWSNQKLYTAQGGLRGILAGQRFLNENAVRLELSRTDPLGKRLSLSSFYQLRWNLSSRSSNDRISNTIFTSLNYKLSPSWTLGLDYQMNWSHYTQVNRNDIFQQLQLRTRYALTKDLSMSVFGGFSFGGSTDDRRQFGLTQTDQLQYDNWSIGINLVFSRGLF